MDEKITCHRWGPNPQFPHNAKVVGPVLSELCPINNVINFEFLYVPSILYRYVYLNVTLTKAGLSAKALVKTYFQKLVIYIAFSN